MARRVFSRKRSRKQFQTRSTRLQQLEVRLMLDADPILDVFLAPANVTQGQVAVLSAAAHDPDGETDPLSYTWTVTRPDGASFQLAGADASFAPALGGNYTVALEVRDDEGATVGDQATINVLAPVDGQVLLTGTIRDFNDTHPDFEKTIPGVVTGLVEPDLGPDGKPVFVGPNGRGAITSSSTFSQWYSDVPGVNLTESLNMPFVESPAGSGVYTFDDNSFFPIDNQLFGNQGRVHNYHFTLELHTQFVYRGPDDYFQFFEADDDVWVFIDKRLAVDLGGVHPPASTRLDLDASFGLTVGQTYSFDMFYAERHTTQSDLVAGTNLEFVPSPSLAGAVYLDANENGIRDAAETGLAGVPVTLTGADQQGRQVTRMTTTAADGSYLFTDLAPGTYAVTETEQPPGYLDGAEAAGTAGGAAGADTIGGIVLQPGMAAQGYDFGELNPPNAVTLIENTDFVVDYRQSFVVPANPQAISFQFYGLSFDTNDPTSINDAFELALVDASGNPLAGTIAQGRDAFFNITEGETPALGGGAIYDPATGTVTLDISHLAPGSTATLVARLVNNDDDVQTQVSLVPLVNVLSSSPVASPTTTTPQTPSRPRQQIDFNHLTDVTASVGTVFRGTSWDEGDKILHAEAELTNSGTYGIRGPVLVAVSGLSEPLVAAYRPDGFLPDGTPYYDVTSLVFSGAGDVFVPSETSGEFELPFYDPELRQFDLGLRVLAHMNSAPAFVTDPRTEVVAGSVYSYNADALDPESDPLTYTLLVAPDGMSVDANGVLTWPTDAQDAGEHAVVVQAADPYGGVTEQSFTVLVVAGLPNRPPKFTSVPIVDAYVNVDYAYQATASDPDDDPLTFSLVSAVRTSDGASLADLDPAWQFSVTTAGLVTWSPPYQLVDQLVTVTLNVDDGHGGEAEQPYEIYVHAEPANRPPVIISDPVTEYHLPGVSNPPSDNADPDSVSLELGLGETTTDTVTVILPPNYGGPGGGGGDPNGQLTIEPEFDAQTLTDALIGGNSGVIVQNIQLSGQNVGGGGVALGDVSQATLTIVQPPVVWIDSVVDAEEGVSAGYFRVKRDRTNGPLTVNFFVNFSSTAMQGSDYAALPNTFGSDFGSITFADGQSYVDIAVDPTGAFNDTQVEGNETVLLGLQMGCDPCSSGAYVLGTPASGTLTIADDDQAATVWIDSVVNAAEGVSAGHFRVMRDITSGPLTVNFSVNFFSAATQGSDYAALPNTFGGDFGSVTFPDGQSYVDIVVDPTGAYNDSQVEGNETVVLDLQLGCDPCGSGAYVLGAPASGTLTIADDDQAATVWIDSVVDAAEGATTGYFRVMRNITSGPLTVNYSVNFSSTAMQGSDYAALPNTFGGDFGWITFAAGQSFVDILVDPTGAYDDSELEGDETVVLDLQMGCDPCGSGAYVLGAPASGTLTIADDDSQMAGGSSFFENSGAGPFTLLGEGDATVWIDSIVNAAEGVSAGHFRVMRDVTSGPLTVNFSVNFSSTATQGSDYAALPNTFGGSFGSVTFPDGQSFVDIVVDPTSGFNDTQVEGNETVVLDLQTGCGPCGGGAYVLGAPASGTLTIADDDQAATVWIDSVVNAEEGVSAGHFRVMRNITSGPLTVNFSVNFSSTAMQGSDYAALPNTFGGSFGSVTFADGQSFVDIIVDPTGVYNDTQVEGNETVVLDLQTGCGPCGGGAYVLGAPASGTLTIADDDQAATVWIDSVVNAEEGVSAGHFRVMRNITSGPLTVNFSVNFSSTAMQGSDYAALPNTFGGDFGSITFADGQSFVDIAVDPTGAFNDTQVEGNETVVLDLQTDCGPCGGGAYVLGAPASGTLTIADDDQGTTVWIDSVVNAEEGVSAGHFRVVRNTTSGALTVNFSVNPSSTATQGSDYAALPNTFGGNFGSVTIPDGQSYVDVVVDPTGVYDDSQYEGNETVVLDLQTDCGPCGGGAYVLGASASGTLTIADEVDNGPVTTVWIDSVVDAEEGVSAGHFRVMRDATSGPLTVNFFVNPASTATQGTDYAALPNTSGGASGSVSFADGQSYVDVVVDPTGAYDDNVVERDETVVLYLQTSGAYALGAPANGTLTIAENDQAATVWIDSIVDAAEGAASGRFRVMRDSTAGPLTVNYSVDPASTATQGTDYAWLSGSVTFADGQDHAEIVIDPTGSYDDALLEGDETVVLHLQAGSVAYVLGVPASGTLTIADDDDVTKVSFYTAIPGANEAGGTSNILVHRTGPTDAEVTVHYSITNGDAVPGADFTVPASSGILSIPAGETFAALPVTLIDDAEVEATESFHLTLSDPAGAVLGQQSEATFAIYDSDGGQGSELQVSFVSSTYSANEQDGQAEIAIQLSQPVAVPVTVPYTVSDGTASDGDDYTAYVGTVTFAPFETQATFTVNLKNDSIIEDDETVQLALGQPQMQYIASTGLFANTGTTYGLPAAGVVLSSGNVSDYQSGPNSSPGKTYAYGVSATPSEEFLLDSISGGVDANGNPIDLYNHFDATRLDVNFDMAPGFDTVYFQLVFGSEEFPEWQYSQFIDSFGIFLNGENVTQVNGAAININHPDMVSYPGTELDGVLAPIDSATGMRNPVLLFAIPVEPGSTGNTLTFIIADASDAYLDSTVYISNLGAQAPSTGVTVVASDPNVQVQNLTGTLENLEPGQPASFDVQFTGDGQAHSFDLLFVDAATGELYGSLPVTINNHYAYDVDAIDDDGDPIVYSLLDAPADASIDPQTGKIDWQPTVPGDYHFKVIAEDGRGGSDVQEYTVTVDQGDPNNAAPTISPVADQTLEEYREFRLDVAAGDADGDALSYYLVGPAYGGDEIPAGLTIDRATGRIDWTPSADQVGVHPVTVRVTDGRGGQAEVEFNLTVEAPQGYHNVNPEIISKAPTAAVVDEAYRYDVQAVDADGDRLTYSLAVAPDGMAIDPETGAIAWRPQREDLGAHTVIVRVTDPLGGSAVEQFTVSVVELNLAPTITSEPEGPAGLNVPWSYALTADDPNGDPVVFRLLDAPAGMTLDGNNIVHWTPDAPGSYRVEILADDQRGGTYIQEFVLEAQANAPAVISSTPETVTTVGEAYSYVITTSDPNPGDTVTLSLDQASLDRGMQLQNGTLSWTPTQLGDFEITLTALDNHGDGQTQSYTLRVVKQVVASRPPEFTSRPTGPAVVGQQWQYVLTAADPDGDAFAFTAGTLPNGMQFDGVDTLTWTPAAASAGESVSVTATDVHGAATTQTFSLPAIDQPPSNEAPRIVSVPTSPVRLGDVYVYQVAASDPNGDSLTYRLDQAPAGMSIDADTGLITWRPGTLGGYGVTVVASDPSGNEDGQSFTLLVVAPVTTNDPPEFNSTPTGPAVRDRQWRYQATATDPNGDAVEFTLDQASIDRGAVIDPNTGLLVWTPAEAGTFDFVISADDHKQGGVVQQSFSLVVIKNAPPMFTSLPPQQTDVNAVYTYAVVASDPNAGDVLTYSLEKAPAGMMIDAQSGALSWTPAAAGLFDVTILVRDQDGAEAKQPYQLLVIDPASNAAPVLGDIPRTQTQAGSLFQYQTPATDDDHDPLVFSLVSGPAGMKMDSHGLLQWTPAASQIDGSPYSYTIHVEDGRGGADERTYSLSVIPQPVNHAPEITSTAGLKAAANRQYAYQAAAADADGDLLTWTLDLAPAGMTLDRRTGLLLWTPTAGQVGSHEVKLRVSDPFGGLDSEEFAIEVRGANRPAMISSTPPVVAVLGQQYVYDAEGSDPDGDPIHFSLDPAYLVGDMTIGAGDGLLTWTPTTLGIQHIIVRVADDSGMGMQQVFDVEVLASAPNDPPKITSMPPLISTAGETYTYDVDAVDPENGQIVYSLSEPNPLVGDLAIDGDTGVITWTPGAGDVGTKIFFTVVATDPAGLKAALRWSLVPRPANHAPTVDAIANQTVTARQAFRYDVRADDADGDPLAYSLVAAPSNMTIDESGRITWSASADDIGDHPVTVRVSDGRAAPVDVSFTLTVAADASAPAVEIIFSQNPVHPGDSVTIVVRATDDVGVASRTLLINGENIPLTSDGSATVTRDEPGAWTVSATVADAAGNIGADSATLVVSDPNDQAPVITFASPDDKAVITAPVDLLGSIVDAENNLQSYTILAAPLDGSSGFKVLGHVEAPTGQTLANLSNQALGRFDPTLLANGAYIIRIEAVDAGLNQSAAERIVNVSGALKLGNFSLSFTDLEVPVAGIPITVTRTYDTLNADRQGDFGYGWKLDLSNTKVTIDRGGSLETGLFGYAPFHDGDRVVITLPDGTTEGFTFYGEQSIQGGYIQTADYLPKFWPDPGVKSQLFVDSRWIRKLGDGYIDMETGRDYTPVDPVLGGGYTLRLRNGTELSIDAQTGELSSITDLSGNTLTFTGMGILSSAGRGVEFERDQAGRITAVIDPAGNRITYDYDGQGNLVAVTDRADATVRFTYLADPQHYLDEIIDPLGRAAARTEYDEQGRIKRVTDADGKTIEYSWNGDSRIQKIADQLGNVTTIETDARGNVIRQEDPAGGVTLKTYDADDNVLSETRVVGLVDSPANGENDDLTTTYTYNADGDRLTVTDPSGNVTRTTYNEFGQPTSMTDPLGNTTYEDYDERGLLGSIRDPSGNVTNFAYDDKGNLTAVRNGDGTLLVTNLYNQFGEVTSTTPAAGAATYFDYDVNGDQVASWHFEGQGAAQVQLLDVTRYDAARRVVGELHVVLPVGAFITQNLSSATIPPQYVSWSTSTSYNGAGQVETTTDQLGAVTQTTYDLRGNTIETKRQAHDENGAVEWLVTRTVYDAAGRVSVTTDEYREGTSAPIWATRNAYDPAGRVIQTERLKGVQIAFEGSPNAYRSVLTDPGTVVSTTTTAYDALGRVATSTDSFGRQTRNAYDRAGNLTETRTQNYDQTGALVWRASRTVYDQYGRAILSTDPFLISADGQETVLTPVILGMKTIYDAQGRVVETDRLQGVSVTLTNGETSAASEGAVISTSKTIYNGKGQVQQTIDPAGRTVDHEYDSLGRQIATIDAPLPAEEVGLTGYAAGTRVRLRSETVYDAKGRVQTERTNVLEIIAPDGTVTRNDSAARETTYEFDEQGNPVGTTFADPDGAGPLTSPTIASTYDLLGRKASDTNQLGETRVFGYDVAGRLASVELPAVANPQNGGAQANPTYQYGYDAFGRQTSIVDPLGRETRFTFDERGNQLSRTLPLGVETQGDPNDFTETFEYDDLGRPTLHVSFEGAVEQSLYDSATGRLSQRRFFPSLAAYNGGAGTPSETWTYKYDAFDRQVEVTQDDGTTVRTTLTLYDAQGRVVMISSPEGALHYEYDPVTGLKTRTYATDPNDPAPVIDDTHYAYDVLGRLKTVEVVKQNSVTLSPQQNTSYQYDPLGNLDLQFGPNGSVVDYIYNNLNQLKQEIQYGPDSTPEDLSDNPKIAEFDYTLRADGKRAAAAETFWFDDNSDGVADPHVNNLAWTYDAAGRLTDEALTSYDPLLSYVDHFTFDLVGNRLANTRDWSDSSKTDLTTASQFDANDRLLTSTETPAAGSATTTTYGYGPGNAWTEQTEKTVVTGSVTTRTETYSYDLQGRMNVVVVEAFDPASGALTSRQRTTYDYDASGIRVSALVETDANLDGAYDTAALTKFLNDPQNLTGYSQVLRETTTDPATGQVQKIVVYAIGLNLISQTTTPYTAGVPGSPETLVFGYDGHGSVRVLLDMAAAIATVAGVQQLFHYDAYGNLLNLSAAQAATSVLYSGQMLDAASGWYYNRARWYDSHTARFNHLDPFFGDIEDPQTLHKYIYARADGINYTDPTGLFPGFPYPVLFPGAPLPDEIQVPVLGTLVHSYLGRQFKAWALTQGLTAWANQQNRTIVMAIAGAAYPNETPFSNKPDAVSWAPQGTFLNLYEIKHADIILEAPFYFTSSVFAATQLINRYIRPLSGMAPGYTFGFGTSFANGYRTWPTFTWSPPGWELISWTNYALYPGVILYDWVPNQVGVYVMALAAIDALAAAYVIQSMAGLGSAIGAGAAGSTLVNQTNQLSLRPQTAPPAETWYPLAASIGLISIGGFGLGGGLA